MLQPTKLSHHFAGNVTAIASAVGDRVKDHCVAMVETVHQVRCYQSELGAVATARSKVAVENAMQASASTLGFARKLIDHETTAAKSFATVKSTTEFLRVRDAYLASSFDLLSEEIVASTDRFFEALSGWTIWPSPLPKASAAS